MRDLDKNGGRRVRPAAATASQRLVLRASVDRLNTVLSMDLTLVLGPVKSGKSFELVSVFAPLGFSTIPHRIYQAAQHKRDTEVTSRSGGRLPTTKIASLYEILESRGETPAIVGIDEVHMFKAEDVAAIGLLLQQGIDVVAAGIDLDHRGELFSSVKALFELGPERVIYRRAVCDRCKKLAAVYTQVLLHDIPFTEEFNTSTPLPDDGTYTYEARCRSCFVLP